MKSPEYSHIRVTKQTYELATMLSHGYRCSLGQAVNVALTDMLGKLRNGSPEVKELLIAALKDEPEGMLCALTMRDMRRFIRIVAIERRNDRALPADLREYLLTDVCRKHMRAAQDKAKLAPLTQEDVADFLAEVRSYSVDPITLKNRVRAARREREREAAQ